MNDLFKPLDLTSTFQKYRLAEKIKFKVVFKQQLSGKSIYQYCPLCLKNLGIKGKDVQRWISLKSSERRKTEDERNFLMSMDSKLQHEENGEIIKHSLYEVKYKELVKVDETTGEVMFNTYLECPMCFKQITMDDFYNVYCAPPKDDTSKKFIRLDDVEAMESF